MGTLERKATRIGVVLYVLLVPVLSGLSSNCSANTSCHLGQSCSSDHSTSSQLAECPTESRSSRGTTPSYNEYNISRCTARRHCASRTNLDAALKFKVKEVTGIVRPVNVSHFTLDVHWNWFPSDLSRTQGKLEGFELRILNNSNSVVCLCIREPSITNISLALEDALEYKSSNPSMAIKLSTFPYDGDWLSNEYTQEETMNWPKECSGSHVCLPKLPSAPRVLNTPLMWTGLGADGSELALAWTPLPNIDIFYVNLENPAFNETLTYFVNGSYSVKLRGIPPRESWTVRIQGYSPCSGLSGYYSGRSTNIGCGVWSQREYIRLPGTTSTPSISSGSIPPAKSQILLGVTLAFALPVLLATVMVSVAVCLCYWKSTTKPGSVYKDIENPVLAMNVIFTKPPKLDALVLYSLSTPTHEKIEIEKYVVGFLKQQHFKVISCNDHTEKTIVQWVEENARLAHVVFVVCNKQFGLDWKMDLRPQLVNSLEMIVASAVGQNKIKKYATILLRPGDEKYIPDNLYFKGMKSFVVGSGSSRDEKANFASFIKFNSAIPW